VAEVNQVLLQQVDQDPASILRPRRIRIRNDRIQTVVGDHLGPGIPGSFDSAVPQRVEIVRIVSQRRLPLVTPVLVLMIMQEAGRSPLGRRGEPVLNEGHVFDQAGQRHRRRWMPTPKLRGFEAVCLPGELFPHAVQGKAQHLAIAARAGTPQQSDLGSPCDST